MGCLMMELLRELVLRYVDFVPGCSTCAVILQLNFCLSLIFHLNRLTQ